MANDKKRKQQLTERAQRESLEFQSDWGAKKRGIVLDERWKKVRDSEISYFEQQGIIDALYHLTQAIDGIRRELGAEPEPTKGIMAGSITAFLLGIDPKNPMECSDTINPDDFLNKLPLQLTLHYDGEVRNKVADWLKDNGYEMSTYMGQPMIKLTNARVVIKRVIKY